MYGYTLRSVDEEKRKLRVHISVLKRAVKTFHIKQEEGKERENTLKKENRKKQKHIEQLEKELEEIKRQRDMYRSMIFKENVKDKKDEEASSSSSSLFLPQSKGKKRGGQTGHIGHGRRTPLDIHFFKRAFLGECSECHSPLNRSSSVSTHTVEDIPDLDQVKPIVTQYQIERQWCSTCKKEVTVTPPEVIPGSRLGINLIVWIMTLKYGARVPLDTIVLLLSIQYGISISKGGIINILHRARNWLGPHYEKIKQEIRASSVQHADETGWRIEGINSWVWAFLKKDAVCYQIEESRGKGVPSEFFKDSNPTAVLVRDDYGAYKNLPLTQQSCWAHMLRKSHEAIEQQDVGKEMKVLHEKLKTIYTTLVTETSKPFIQTERQTSYDQLAKNIQLIINTPFTSSDTLRIQTRVRNQNRNLLTAVLYPDVPLTNNHAERNIRPLVVTRKISGGSRSFLGAQTHMTNMSIFQTIKLKNLPLISTLKAHLLQGALGKN